MSNASTGSSFLSRGSSGNSSNMRGLVQFIADLRNARARELEEKRINKELANIRSVPSGHSLAQTILTFFLILGKNSKVRHTMPSMQIISDCKCRWKPQWLSQEKICLQGDLIVLLQLSFSYLPTAPIHLYTRMECRFRASRSRKLDICQQVLRKTNWVPCHDPIPPRRPRIVALGCQQYTERPNGSQ